MELRSFTLLRQWWSPRARERRRLQRLPRFCPGTSELLGFPIQYADALSYLAMVDEIFEREFYRFNPRKAPPFIIDGGANIGLATIYFARTYPGARIISFEADPVIFRLLQGNVAANAPNERITLINKALCARDGMIDFLPQGADAGRVRPRNDVDTAQTEPVEAVRLGGFLQERVDFLKLDIEGAETEVLIDAAENLQNVDHLFVEYHSFIGRPQQLGDLLTALGARFRLLVETAVPLSRQPFIGSKEYLGMDLQLNIFGKAVRPG